MTLSSVRIREGKGRELKIFILQSNSSVTVIYFISFRYSNGGEAPSPIAMELQIPLVEDAWLPAAFFSGNTM